MSLSLKIKQHLNFFVYSTLNSLIISTSLFMFRLISFGLLFNVHISLYFLQSIIRLIYFIYHSPHLIHIYHIWLQSYLPNFVALYGAVAQWLRRSILDPGIPLSKPLGGFKFFHSSEFYQMSTRNFQELSSKKQTVSPKSLQP